MLQRLVDFSLATDLSAWHPVDDVVMGGVSRSSMRRAQPGIANFSGMVSLARGGGFASVRTDARSWHAAGATAFVLHCHGDGKTYKFTARTEDSFDGVQYQQRFTTAKDAWATVTLPVAKFTPSFRGREVPGAAALDPARLRQLGLMVSDRQDGPFELLLDWIAAEIPG